MLMPMYKLKQANPDRPSFPYHAWFVFYCYCYDFDVQSEEVPTLKASLVYANLQECVHSFILLFHDASCAC